MNLVEYLLEDCHPESVAVVDAAGPHTYDELLGLIGAQRLAIGSLGLPMSSPIAIHGPNDVGWVAAYLATIASGMVAVPVPETLAPPEVVARLGWIGAAATFLGRREFVKLGKDVDNPLPTEADAASGGGGRAPAVVVPDDADAVYAFTSGTTGRPRAVRLTHGNLRANTRSILDYLELDSGERILVVLPFSYVFGASLLHTHLRVGATLVIQSSAAFPQSIVEQMREARCTGLAGVPSTFHMLLRNSSFGREPLPDLRTIQQAGGKLVPVLIQELTQAQPQARVFVMYGQTEATARLSALPPAALADRIGSIGRGIPGVDLRVVGPDGAPVAPGEVGEIYATGDNISPGYLGDPDETARKMPGGVLHTGDLATVDEDGYIFVVDRQEDFIKSWGYRIASQEVEAAAMQLPDLVAVAVVGVPDDAAGERVEMVAVRRPGAALSQEEVLRHCRTLLPKYMIPSSVHFVARIPLNANGKVSKASVRDMCLRVATGDDRREHEAKDEDAGAAGVHRSAGAGGGVSRPMGEGCGDGAD